MYYNSTACLQSRTIIDWKHLAHKEALNCPEGGPTQITYRARTGKILAFKTEVIGLQSPTHLQNVKKRVKQHRGLVNVSKCVAGIRIQKWAYSKKWNNQHLMLFLYYFQQQWPHPWVWYTKSNSRYLEVNRPLLNMGYMILQVTHSVLFTFTGSQCFWKRDTFEIKIVGCHKSKLVWSLTYDLSHLLQRNVSSSCQRKTLSHFKLGS